MDFKVCFQCKKEVEGDGVLFRNKVFCGDECCDQFEGELSTENVPSMEDLNKDEDGLMEEVQDDLGYRDGDDLEDDLDDDFSIQEDDF